MDLRLFPVFFCAVSLAGQTTPPATTTPQQNPTETKPASLSGKTVTADGRPIKKVALTLRVLGPFPNGQPAPAPYAVASNAEGKFIFEVVDPGRYTLFANRPGYQSTSYGARRPNTSGTVLTLTSGQTVSAIELVLSPQIVVSGKVLDSDGDPIGRVQVQALRSMYAGGKRQLVVAASSSSDENGEYKVQNLAPGKYYFSASAPRDMFNGLGSRSAAAPPPAGQPPRQEEAHVQTYYPGVTDVAAATSIELVAGRDRPGTDMTMHKSPVFHLRGKVAGQLSGDRSPVRALVASRSSVYMAFNGASSPVDKNSAFDVSPVPAGSYYVLLIESQGTSKVLGYLSVDVTDRNVENLTLVMEPPVDVTGLIKREFTDKAASSSPDPSKGAPARVQISLQSVDGLSFNPPNGPTKDDDTFVLTGVTPGRYKVSVYSLPDGMYLKAIRSADQDVLKNNLTVVPGAGSAPLEVTLSAKAAKLTGTVEDSEGKSVRSATVTLIPDPPAPDRGDLYKQSNTDQNGQFTLSSIAPGKYRVYAWTDLEPGNQFDPEFLKNYESKGVKLDIDESAAPQIKLIPVQQ